MVYGKSHCKNLHVLLGLSLESFGKMCLFILDKKEMGKDSKNHKKKAPIPQGRRDIAQKQPFPLQKHLSTARRLSKDRLMEAAGASSSSEDSLTQRLFVSSLSISFSSPGSVLPNVFDRFPFPFLKAKLFTPAALRFI